MSLFKRSGGEKVLSLDIGSDSIKLLASQGTYPGNISIFDYRLLHINTTGKGVNPAEIPAILKSVLPEIKMSVDCVRTIVSGQAAIVRVIEMPEMNKTELKQSVSYQLGRYIPMRPDDVQFDCTPMQDQNVRKGFQKCLLVVVRRTVIDELNKIINACGLSPLLIDVEPIAVTNCYLACSRDFDREQGIPHIEDSAGVCLLHMGANHTDMIIMRGKVPLVCRALETGTSGMFSTIAETLEISYVDAVDMMNEGKEHTEITGHAIHNFAETLVREIRTSLDYCSREYDLKTERMYITGAPAENVLLCQALTIAIDIPVYRFDPFVNIPLSALENRIGDFRSKAPAFAPVLGMAIRTLS